MASLLGSTVATNYAKNVRANGLGPRTIILKLEATNITEAQLNAWIGYLTSAQGSNGTGDSAFTVAGFSAGTDGSAFVAGETDAVVLALQGTGSFTDATVEGLTGTPTATIVAVFDQNYQ